ncbi:RNA-binding protein Musashi homolog 2-like isoform X4 [Vespa mandarinia]|uniref:RNA-binding protein Musashi homolog 2-like isoform X4 n=1 Tax=Vespa mandarinia TaxID=7446 RepID=UPI001615A85A|nr:RNA-binding protein Musashi homolog 2-like isoform X4 [Vespa mandarinia]
MFPYTTFPAVGAGMEAANGAIEHDFHNALVPINGSHSGSSGRSTPNGGDPAPGKLFVGGLSWQTSSEKLREYFGMFGTVTDVLIMKDPVTQRSRGFGFITFAEPGSVDKVLKCPIHTLDGKKIDPKHATPKNRAKQANRTKKIFVGGVSQETSSEEVKAYFNQFGKVEETVMLMDQQTKRHRGFGFVTFENEDVVDRVCEIHFHTIKNKKVECKKAQPKEAVQPGALALGKRVVLGALGVRLAPQPPLPVAAAASQIVAAQAQAQVQAAAAAAAAAQVQNAVAGYGKLFASSYPALSAYRYAPYPIPAAASPAAAAAPGNPYQGYSLTNVDMSSFQGVDWGSMYGMGMYV